MVKRKMLVADERLAEQLAYVAKKRGQTLFSLLNEIFDHALRVYRNGLTLKPILDEWERMKAMKEAGFIYVVKPLWIDIVNMAFSSENKSLLLKKWYEAGRWYGKYFATKSAEDPILNLRDFFSNLMWGSSEFVMEVNNEEGQIRCISADFPSSYTELLGSFFQGALDALGYKCKSKEVSKGFIRIIFQKCKVEEDV